MNDGFSIKGDVLVEIHDAKTGELKDSLHLQNLVVTAGKNSIADALRGTTSNNKGIITYCGVGTSNSAPTAGDTSLNAELARKAISVRSVSGKVATFRTFFNTSEANGTLNEAGLFGDDASGTANSGTLFCHVNNINRTKSSADTLTLTWNVTIG